MSQPYGRSQARGNKPRPLHQPAHAKPSQPQKKHFAKPAAPRDATQTASVIKTRAFRLLVNAAGAENLALALDSNLSRIAELADGERFTPETAFHMETTLGLPHGFFDQPNPVLTEEVMARLRSPLDNLQKDAAADELDDQSEQTVVASSVGHSIASDVASTRNYEMATKAQKATATPPSVKKGYSASNRDVPQKGKGHAATKALKPSKAELQQSLELASEPSALEIRRANLHVLTARNGSKALLSRLLNLSQSNMAHRLHGKKRLDDAESERITSVLDLPSGWLDTPRETGDVPAAVADKLTPPTRHRSKSPLASHLQNASSTYTVEDAAQNSDRIDQALEEAGGADPEAQGNLVAAVSGELADSNVNNFPPETVPTVAAVAHVHTSNAYPSTEMTDLDTLRGIAPIAEALLKTLAGKARTGRLDEGRALRLLQQIVLL